MNGRAFIARTRSNVFGPTLNDEPPTPAGPPDQSPCCNGGLSVKRQPKTVLVLGGGGMRGMAHVGVLKALDRQSGIRYDADRRDLASGP